MLIALPLFGLASGSGALPRVRDALDLSFSGAAHFSRRKA